jgi:FkbM family methyltransferase
MSAPPLTRHTVRRLRGVGLLRRLHRFVPLGRKYFPLLALLNSGKGLCAIPFDRFQLVHPAAWRKQAANFLLLGPEVVPEFQLLASLCRGLQPGAIVDAGANLGVYTLLLRSVTDLPIIAYEPQPFLFQLLQWNIDYNQLPQVKARNLACGNQRGKIPFIIGINGAVAPAADGNPTGTSATTVPVELDVDQQARLTRDIRGVVHVPVTTLDEELAEVPAVALLKIDCEGYEHLVLEGARGVIERHRPHLFLELHPTEVVKFGGSSEGIVKLLESYYTLECWNFSLAGHQPRLIRRRTRSPQTGGYRYADVAEMLAVCRTPIEHSQNYVIGRPRPR